MTLTELIAKLEKAEKGSRELDVAIYVTIFPFPCVELHPEAQRYFDEGKAPHYTVSLDAALTLVPEKHFWCIEYANTDVFDVLVKAEDSITGGWSQGKTPALALCIAALKAGAS